MIQTNLLTSLLGQEAPIIPCMQREPLPHMVWYKQRLFLETMCVCACSQGTCMSQYHVITSSVCHSSIELAIIPCQYHRQIYTNLYLRKYSPSEKPIKESKRGHESGKGGLIGKGPRTGIRTRDAVAQQRNNWHISQKAIGAEGMQILITTVSQS